MLEKLETRIIDNEDFVERYERLKRRLDEVHGRFEEIAVKGQDVEYKKAAMQASFEDLVNLKRTWTALDAEGRNTKLQAIVDRITARETAPGKLKLRIQVFLDSLNSKKRLGFVGKVSRRGTGSWRPRA